MGAFVSSEHYKTWTASELKVTSGDQRRSLPYLQNTVKHFSLPPYIETVFSFKYGSTDSFDKQCTL